MIFGPWSPRSLRGSLRSSSALPPSTTRDRSALSDSYSGRVCPDRGTRVAGDSFAYSSYCMGVLLAIAATLMCLAVPRAALATPGEGCPNEQVRTESNVNPATGEPYSLGLPECRAYEMVSPLAKQAHDAQFRASGALALVAPGGNAVGFGSEGSFADAENYRVQFDPSNTYIARRLPTGWTTESALVPASVIADPSVFGFHGDASPGLSTLATCGNTGDITTAIGTTADFACARRQPDGAWTSTPSYPSFSGEPSDESVVVWGSSTDLADIVWQPGHGEALTPEDRIGGIYESLGLDGSAPQLRLTSVNNEGVALTTEGGNSGPYFGAARRNPNVRGSAFHAVSSDGETVFFTAEPAGGGCLTLFARTGDFAGGRPARPTTVSIGCQAVFVGASPDGSRVFFTSPEPLVPGDTDSTSDLYEYNFSRPAGHQYVQISAGGLGDPAPGTGAEVSSTRCPRGRAGRLPRLFCLPCFAHDTSERCWLSRRTWPLQHLRLRHPDRRNTLRSYRTDERPRRRRRSRGDGRRCNTRRAIPDLSDLGALGRRGHECRHRRVSLRLHDRRTHVDFPPCPRLPRLGRRRRRDIASPRTNPRTQRRLCLRRRHTESNQ
jgi:hypothetical protein